MRDNEKTRIERCAYCGGKVTIRDDLAGLMFFDCHDCGARVSFRNIIYPSRLQADDPVACFNRRHSGKTRKGHDAGNKSDAKKTGTNNEPQQCPKCRARSNVYGLSKRYNGLLRYRKCPECGWTFKTIETRIQAEEKESKEG